MAPLRLLVAEGNVRATRERVAGMTGLEPAESYARVLAEIAPGATVDIVRPADEGANLPGPEGLSAYDGVAITGSALNVYKDEPAVTGQVEFARAVFAAGVPFFGSCWGLQVATVAAGGVVRANPRGREVAFARRLWLTEAGRAHPMHSGRPPVFDAPAVHMDEVETLPPDAMVTATNSVSDVQAAEIRHDGGIFWGVQYHPEYGFRDISAMLERYRPILLAEGLVADDATLDAIVADLTALEADPARRDLAWRYGLDTQLIDAAPRRAEIRNWIEHQVKPTAAGRGRG